jgi:hypothetical protein
MKRWVNRDLARWFALPASKEYGFHIRIVGSIVELHAEHHSSGQRYVARARRMEEAAPELLRMMRDLPPPRGQRECIADPKRGNAVTHAWKSAAKAFSYLYAAVAK